MKRNRLFRFESTQEGFFDVRERESNALVAKCMILSYAKIEDNIELAETIIEAYAKYHKAIHTIKET